MVTKFEYIKNEKGETLSTITHILSEHGHFEKDGKHQGIHIAFGPNSDMEGYTEVIDEGVSHNIPDAFPDIIITDEDGDDGEDEI